MPDPTDTTEPYLPNELFRRPTTNTFYTAGGTLFATALDPRLAQYAYSATTYGTQYGSHGAVEIWRLRRSPPGPTPD